MSDKIYSVEFLNGGRVVIEEEIFERSDIRSLAASVCAKLIVDDELCDNCRGINIRQIHSKD